jgi:hypothetical protein
VRGTNAVPGMSRDCARYEPVAWFNRNRIGRDLRGWYELPKELPSKLHALIRKLDPIECSEINRADTGDSPISTQDVFLASARSIAELDAPAPSTTVNDP